MTDAALCERIAESLKRCNGRVRGDDWEDAKKRLGLNDVTITKFKSAVQSMAHNRANPWRVGLSRTSNRHDPSDPYVENPVTITLMK